MVLHVKDKIISVVGLGYVGLPLLLEFAKHFKVIGFDANKKKVEKYSSLHKNVTVTDDPVEIKKADVVIIAVPTPVTKTKQPDLSFVESAGRIVGQNLKKGAIVVLESTVYPGVTEEVLGPILEKESKMILGKDFKIGYSPERVNPGDKNHTIDKIVKIVSAMDEETTEILAEIYGKITTVYKAENIKTAEAAKVIENIQRDLNIALMNELSIIFNKLGLNTKAILEAASTKWNFNKYYPGLVGGHCIPVDPYYLVYKTKATGYHPQVILAGRAVNDSMPKYVAELSIKALNEAGAVIKDSKVLIMGLTFKENVDDTRETPVVEIIKELKEFKCQVYGYDPLISKEEIKAFGITPVDNLFEVKVDCVIITVLHDEFKKLTLKQIKSIMKEKPVLIDVRGGFRNAVNAGFIYRSL
ncbi:MAG: nucleotide sugar dehydrogenase [Candidatus Thermoplasmatota archaeon]|jgi:UDPglucose 6-dehydrogenase/UDP-N-acetyl-D-galactosamine dehydrogenase|nr:nucleotide sugar dehydrogenase [Candidatus Thermoplasmatota archaeon]